MQEPSFDALAAEAAAGLKGDRELYLEIKEELQTHLEDKAAKYASDGHDEEESVALAKKSFGSPLDMAAELVEANRGRMRLRGLLRLGFNALVIPLAIVLAIYVGYGRLARLSWIQATTASFVDSGGPTKYKLPALPFMGIEEDPLASSDLHQLRADEQNAADIHRYWEAHRSDSDSNIYYAYYSLFANENTVTHWKRARNEQEKEELYAAEMHHGEQLEPQNALYNTSLAIYYLQKGMIAKEERAKGPEVPQTDEVWNRHAFELGIAELQNAARKPYLHTYQMEVLRKKLVAIPAPRFTEDYLQLLMVASSETFPEYAKWRALARKIPGCARLLLAEGRRADAEAVMDTWKPLSLLLMRDPSNSTLIKVLVARAVATILSEKAAEIYDRLGATAKADEARSLSARLEKEYKDWKTAGNARNDASVALHGSIMANTLLPVFSNTPSTMQELTPGRMHDHVIAEEVAVQIVMLLLMLALLGTVGLGALWLLQMRRAAAIPFLLLPPAKEMARALLLGLVLPIVVYWVYSRLPGIGGREFGWRGMWPRFIIELGAVGLVMIWLPAFLIKRYIHRRCEGLGIALPPRKEEWSSGWKVYSIVFAALLLAAVALFFATQVHVTFELVAALLMAAGLIGAASRYALKKRREHGLYYGTLARSMAAVYAFAILFLAIIVQPWLLYNEAQWLRRDTICFGYLAEKQNIAGFTSIEAKTVQRLNAELLTAMGEKP